MFDGGPGNLALQETDRCPLLNSVRPAMDRKAQLKAMMKAGMQKQNYSKPKPKPKARASDQVRGDGVPPSALLSHLLTLTTC